MLWSSVRDAMSMLPGGNLDDVVFTVGVGLLGGPGVNTR